MQPSTHMHLPLPVRVPACRKPIVCEGHEQFFQKHFSDDDVKKIAKEIIQLRVQLGRNSDIYLKACIKLPKENVTYNCLCGVWLGTAGKRIYTRLKRQVSLESERQKKSRQKRLFEELTNTVSKKSKSKERLQLLLIDQGKELDKLRVCHTKAKKELVKQRRRASLTQTKLDEKGQVIYVIIFPIKSYVPIRLTPSFLTKTVGYNLPPREQEIRKQN